MKRFLATLLCATMFLSASVLTVPAQESIDLLNDDRYGEVAFDADFAQVGVPLSVKIEGHSEKNLIYRWYIDGKRIDNNSASYAPGEYDLQSMISVDVFKPDGSRVGTAEMFISDLPVIYIETENNQQIVSKENYINADMKIQGNAEFNTDYYLYNGKTEIRGRGNSTWNTQKKPYRLKLDEKSDLFGMGKSKHWVLLSNPFDTSLLRNHISYNLAADMGLGYQKTVWVDLVLNGVPVGNYQLCEHIRVDENRVEITNWEDLAEDAAKAIYNANKSSITKDERDELIDIMSEDMSWTTSNKVTFKETEYTVSDYIEIPDINGGYLLEVVRKDDEYTFTTKNGAYVCVDTPEVLSEDMLNSIQGYYQAFENALFAEDFCTIYNGETMRYTDFIDLDSFVKGFLLNELFENFDFGRTSTWISKDVDGKLVYGPVWDMDNALESTTFFKWTSLNVDWLRRLLSDPIFLQKLRKTYFEYRYTAINDLLKDGGDIDAAAEKIRSSAKYNDYIWNNQVTFDEDVLDLKLRLQYKINWFDSVLTDLPSAYASMANNISNMEYVNSDRLSLSFNKEKNSLGVEFKEAVPYLVKIFADGRLCTTYKPTNTHEDIILPKIRENAVITAVCYDENSNIVFGSYCITENEIIKLFVSSRIPKFTYDAGETLDLDEIELTARYSDGTEKKVKAQLAYTYIKDSIGDQFFSYDKVTYEIGKTFIVLRYKNAVKEYEIQVNPRENHKEVIAMIRKLPKEINGNRFISELFEAKIAYDSLSEGSKAKVTNISKLNSLMANLSDAESESTGIVACASDGIFRINARSTLLVISKGNPAKIVFTNPNSTTATFTTASSAYLYKRTVGDYTVSTIRHLIPDDANYKFAISPVYSDLHKTEAFEISTSEIANEAKLINSMRYPKWINEGETFDIEVNKDKDVEFFAFYENDVAVKFKSKDTAGTTAIRATLATPGKHTLNVFYSYGNSSVEYGTIEVFVREYKEESNRIFSIDYPAESYSKKVQVNIATSADVNTLSLTNDERTVEMTAKTSDSLKFWTAEIDITQSKEYTLLLNGQPTQTVICPKKLDIFSIDGTKLVKYLADEETVEIPSYITEIADDAFEGFDGTILCYPNSVAESFAKEKGINFVTFSFRVNATEISLDSEESFEIEISADPYLPQDFNLTAEFDENIISFDGKTLKALKPGYTNLILRGGNSLYEETVFVSVGGGPRKADINADGKINSSDALIVLQHSVQSITLTDEKLDSADVNGDGKINSMDALIILQISTGKLSIRDLI